MNVKRIRELIAVTRRAMSMLEAELEGDDGLFDTVSAQAVGAAPSIASPPVDDIRKRSVAAILSNPSWPLAVEDYLATVTLSEDDHRDRARMALDFLIDVNLEDKSFLDFGCGEGYMAAEALDRGAALVHAFDIQPSPSWSNIPGVKFSHLIHEVPRKTFDVVLAYDVLDHCPYVEAVMEQIKATLKPGGLLYVRCHPWTSRHGAHLHKQGLNRAFMHMFLNFGEQQEALGQSPTFVRAETYPLESYKHWFRDFEIVKEMSLEEPVEEFFSEPGLKGWLLNDHQVPPEKAEAFFASMQVQFVDLQMRLKKN